MQQGRFVSIRGCSCQRLEIRAVHFWRATLGQFWRALKLDEGPQLPELEVTTPLP
jgi:hypothetical protein